MTQPYINFGRFVVDCPACRDARMVEPGQLEDACINGHRIVLNWPRGAAQAMAALADRPEENRNWFPADHPFAVATGQPHGQTVAELKAEAKHHAEAGADKRQQVADAMKSLGLEFDPATGLVKGL